MEHVQGRIDHIHGIVQKLLHQLKEKSSPEFGEIIQAVPIRVLWDSEEHNRYGDFFGVPLDVSQEVNTIPGDIILYARPLLEESEHDEYRLHDIVKKTLMHEIGHYLGLDHHELTEHGWN